MNAKRIVSIIKFVNSDPPPSEETLVKAEQYLSGLTWSLHTVQDDLDELCRRGYMRRVYEHEFIWHYKFIRREEAT